MKIVVIGSIFYDYIYPYKEEQSITSLGGILYNLITLALLAQKSKNSSSIALYPISYLGEDHYQEFLSLCREYPNIYFDGIKVSKSGTAIAELHYISYNTRIEIIKLCNPAIQYNEIEPYLDADAFLINFTAGLNLDIELATLERIRAATEAIIYIDVHNLVSEIQPDGKRVQKQLDNWKEWVMCADIVQSNQVELALLVNNPKILQAPQIEEAEIFKTHQIILKNSINTKIIITTLAERGAIVSYRKNKSINSVHSPAYIPERIIDTTGCGDIFASAFLWDYLNHRNPISANIFANRIAGIATSVSGLTGLKKINL